MSCTFLLSGSPPSQKGTLSAKPPRSPHSPTFGGKISSRASINMEVLVEDAPPPLTAAYADLCPAWLAAHRARTQSLARPSLRADALRASCLLLQVGLFDEALDILDATTAATGPAAPDEGEPAVQALCRFAHRLRAQYLSVTSAVAALGIAITPEAAKRQCFDSSDLFATATSSPLVIALHAWLLNSSGSPLVAERLCNTVESMHGGIQAARRASAAVPPAPRPTSAAAPFLRSPLIVNNNGGGSGSMAEASLAESGVILSMAVQCAFAQPLCYCLRLLQSLVPQPFTPRQGLEMQRLLASFLATTAALPPSTATSSQSWVVRLLPGVAELEEISTHVRYLCEQHDEGALHAHLVKAVEEGSPTGRRQHGRGGGSKARAAALRPSRLSIPM